MLVSEVLTNWIFQCILEHFLLLISFLRCLTGFTCRHLLLVDFMLRFLKYLLGLLDHINILPIGCYFVHSPVRLVLLLLDDTLSNARDWVLQVVVGWELSHLLQWLLLLFRSIVVLNCLCWLFFLTKDVWLYWEIRQAWSCNYRWRWSFVLTIYSFKHIRNYTANIWVRTLRYRGFLSLFLRNRRQSCRLRLLLFRGSYLRDCSFHNWQRCSWFLCRCFGLFGRTGLIDIAKHKLG